VLIHVDIQFKCIKDRKNIAAMINVVSKEEHVVDIERYHRVIKERVRCYYAMLPFDTLPRMMVVQLMNTVVFYLNAFVWRKGVSNVLPPVTIIEGTVIDYYKHFHVVFGEFVQTFEGSDNTMNKRTIDAIALGPNGNLQGGIRCFSLSTGKILSRQACDVHILKWPDSAIHRINFINRKQKSVKGLKFGNRQNAIDAAVTGAEVGNNGDVNNDEEILSSEDEHADDVNGNREDEHEDEIGNSEDEHEDEINGNSEDEHEAEINDNVDADNSSPEDGDEGEESEVELVVQENSSRKDEDGEKTSQVESVALENRADEVDPLPTTRSRRTYKPYDWAKHFPETAHTQYREGAEGTWSRSYYIDNTSSMVKRLSTSMFYQDSYFREDIEETKLKSGNYSEVIECWDDKDQYQLYHKALDWLGFRQNDIVELSFKAQQWSVQQGIRKFGDEGKKSAMKEIKNLAVKNNCFGEVDYKSLSQEKKDKALPILMFKEKKYGWSYR